MHGQQVAVKIEKPTAEANNPGFASMLTAQFECEIEILYTHCHANICTLLSHCEGDPASGHGRALVYEYCANGCLYDRLQMDEGADAKHPHEALTWQQRVNIAVGTARGLAFLHSDPNGPVIHRDVKTANILLDAKMQPKVSPLQIV
jgi:serine/threonine protein kinase